MKARYPHLLMHTDDEGVGCKDSFLYYKDPQVKSLELIAMLGKKCPG